VEIQEQLQHLKDYLKIRTELMIANPKRWLNSNAYYQLPSFEYYMKHCVLDRGGAYDFTIRHLRSPYTKYQYKDFCQNIDIENGSITRYSVWMGTPFNFKTEII
jgi:hypothetical protein